MSETIITEGISVTTAEPKKKKHKVQASSLANLRAPWKPGESGNPGGRPKTKPITDAYLRMLDPKTADRIAAAMLTSAENGSVKAAVELREATEGKLPTPAPII